MRRAFLWVLGLGLAGAACTACAGPPRTPYGAGRALGSRLEGNVQSRRLSCEARSASDLLAAHGVVVSEDDVLARIPRSDDPDLGFVGDPDDLPGRLPPHGYGVHAGPVADALRALGLDARAEHGRDLAWIARETDAGRPVIAWVTGSFAWAPPSPSTSRAGRKFVAVRGEHTVLVLAVRNGDLLVLDPASGRMSEVDAATFDRSWALLGRSAISATRVAPAPPTGPPAPVR